MMARMMMTAVFVDLRIGALAVLMVKVMFTEVSCTQIFRLQFF